MVQSCQSIAPNGTIGPFGLVFPVKPAAGVPHRCPGLMFRGLAEDSIRNS